MPEYLVLGFRGGAPESLDEARVLNQRWEAWLGTVKDHVVDAGGPFGEAATHAAEGTGAQGYFTIRAGTLEEALAVARTCPAVEDGGGIEVLEKKNP